MLSESVTTPTLGRKPPPAWPMPPRARRTQPSARTSAGDHYVRQIVADRVKQATRSAHASRAFHDRLEAAANAIEPGRARAVKLGRVTACRVLAALGREYKARQPRNIAGSAVAFCAALGIKVGVDAASAALRLVAAATPILVRIGRYVWSARIADYKADFDHAFGAGLATETPSCARSDDAFRQERPLRESEPDRTGSRKHARAVVLVQHSAAPKAVSSAPMASGLGCASPTPAETAGARPTTSPASTGDAPLAPHTRSAYLQALPRYRRQHQAVALLMADGPDARDFRTTQEAARALLGSQAGRKGHAREGAAVARALEALRGRGDISAGFALPGFALNPWLVLLGVRPRPSATRPTSGQARYLRARGIDPAGLSRDEARAVQATIQRRKDDGLLWPRQMQRFAQSFGWADRLVDACDAGRIGAEMEASARHLRRLDQCAYLKLMSRGRMH